MFKYILILVLIFFSIPCLYAGDLFYNFSFELKLFNKKMPLFKNLPSSMKDIQLIKNKARFEKNFNSNSKDTAFIIEMVNSFIKLHFLEIKFSIEEMKKVRKIILEHVKDVDLKKGIELQLGFWEKFFSKKGNVDLVKVRKALMEIKNKEIKSWFELVTALAIETLVSRRSFIEKIKLLIHNDSKNAQFHFLIAKLLLSQLYSQKEFQPEILKVLKKSVSLKGNSNDYKRDVYRYLKAVVSNQEIFSHLDHIFLIFYYQLGLKYEPFSSAIKNNLAYIYTHYQNTFPYAKKLIDSALSIEPENPYFLDTRGWIFFKNGLFDEAEKDFLKAFSINQEIPDLCYHLASIYYSRGKIEEAVKYFKQAYLLAPQRPLILNDYGYLLVDNDIDYKLGMKLCSEAVKRESDDTSYLDSLAWVYLKTGDPISAVNLFTKVLSKVSHMAEGKYHLAVTNLHLGNEEKALSLVREAHIDEPGFRKNVFLLGEMYVLRQLLKEDVSSHNVDKRALHYALIGNLYEKYFLWSKASEYYEKACKLFPENKFINNKCQGIQTLISDIRKINLLDGLNVTGTLDILSFLPESAKIYLGGLVEQKENKFRFFSKLNSTFSKLFFYIEADKKLEPIFAKLISNEHTNFMIFYDAGNIIFTNSREWKTIISEEGIEFPDNGKIEINLSKDLKKKFNLDDIGNIYIEFSGKGISSLNLVTKNVQPQILLGLSKKYMLTLEKLEKTGMVYDLKKKIMDYNGNRIISYNFAVNYNHFISYLKKLVKRIIKNEMLPDLYRLETALQPEKQYK